MYLIELKVNSINNRSNTIYITLFFIIILCLLIIKKSITTHTYILSFADFQKITLYEKLIF